MKTLKVKMLNEFGNALNLKGAESIMFLFPYLGHRTLSKSKVNVVDEENGIVEVTLDEMDIDGLNVGEGQNFKAEVVLAGTTHTVLFTKGLNVTIKEGKKAINERHFAN